MLNPAIASLVLKLKQILEQSHCVQQLGQCILVQHKERQCCQHLPAPSLPAFKPPNSWFLHSYCDHENNLGLTRKKSGLGTV